jgi:hypothetical protein
MRGASVADTRLGSCSSRPRTPQYAAPKKRGADWPFWASGAIASLSRYPNVSHAARVVGVNRRSIQRLRRRSPSFALAFVSASEATIATRIDATASSQPDLALWAGTVSFAAAPEPGQFRLLIQEREYLGEERLIFAETFELDRTLAG